MGGVGACVHPVSHQATHAAGRDGLDVRLDSDDFRIVVDSSWLDLSGKGESGLVGLPKLGNIEDSALPPLNAAILQCFSGLVISYGD